MMREAISVGLVDLLNRAIARELQVSIQCMFPHAIGASQWLPVSGRTPGAKRAKFVASHALCFLLALDSVKGGQSLFDA